MFSWLRERFLGTPRSGKWPAVRKQHLEREPACAACGRTKNLDVHHIKPFKDHPELELDDGNLISLCGDPCHFVHGHLMSWMRSNPDVRADCEAYRRKMLNFGCIPDE
jgi:hypothetical protein